MRTRQDLSLIIRGQIISHSAAFVAGASLLVVVAMVVVPNAMPRWAIMGWFVVFAIDLVLVRVFAKQTATLIDRSGRVDELALRKSSHDERMATDGEDE